MSIMNPLGCQPVCEENCQYENCTCTCTCGASQTAQLGVGQSYYTGYDQNKYTSHTLFVA